MKILFFLPRCTRTGSEIALHHLICGADRREIKMAVACGGSTGELFKKFPADVPTFDYTEPLSIAARSLASVYHRAYRLAHKKWPPLPPLYAAANEGAIKLIHQRVNPDCWYINTLVQPHVLSLARELNVPCILHTHELERMLLPLAPEHIDDLVKYPKLIIANSHAAANVMRVLGRRDNLEVCYAPTEIERVKSSPQERAALRHELGIVGDAFVWAMAGTRDVNKNPVMFVRVAAETLKAASRAHFIWIGGEDTGYSMFARALAKDLGIENKVTWIQPREPDYYDYLNVADALVLTSTQESLSLVAIEMAALGKPIASFNSGGPTEIIKEGMGVVVDSSDEAALAAAMLRVMNGEVYLDPEISRERAKQFDVHGIVKQWEGIIRTYMAPSTSADS